jgi:class 3 adenylate cyclase/tetratricopeptide (TPR) repeat protein
MLCTNCGRKNASDSRFCSGCGRPLASTHHAREERKVVSVLFCDLVEFTTRAERLDPEEVRAIQAPYYVRVRAELERHGGTVEKFIGDAVMALFGAPLAHEDDPERAVRAALAIRDWVAETGELRVRIAITTGEALVRLEAQPLSGEGMASGDVVNTAARLQAAAPENGVLVDEATYRATKNVVDYRGARRVEAKGKAEPVAVWEPLGTLLPIRPARQPHAPFVGREHELAVLKDTFTSALTDGSIRLVTLVGVPGIGKSRLVRELFTDVERDGMSVTWLQGHSLPYGAGVTLWALGEIVKAHATILESDGGENADEKLRRAVSDAVGDATDADWVLAHLRPLVAPSSEGEIGGDRRAEGFAAWRRFFEALSAQRPLVLVLEDVHWADDTLLDFVEYLVEWATEGPLLVLATARPELLDRRPAWSASRPGVGTVMLAPLSDVETTQLLASLLERPLLRAETQATLLTQAAGNPLYAEEYVRLLTGREGDAEPGTAPETVQGITAARIDGLLVEEKALLQDAAVVGTVFWSGVVGVMSGRDRWAVEKRLLALERGELLRRDRQSAVEGETQYAFLHDLIREVAYGEIPHGERSDKHLRAAEWIESLGRSEDHAELLANHYVRALEYAHSDSEARAAIAKQARLALRDAGDRAFSLNAFAQAASLYRDALALWPSDDPARPLLMFRYASTLPADDAAQERMLEAARDALLAVHDLETAAEAEAQLAAMWWFRGQGDLANQSAHRAVSLVRDRPPSAAKVRSLAAFARLRMFAHDSEEAIRVGGEALAIANALGLDELRADLLVTVGTASWNAGDSSGEVVLERGLDTALAHGALRVAQRAYNNLAGVMGYKGDFPRRVELIAEAMRLAEQLGEFQSLRHLRAQMSDMLLDRGEWDAALRIADEFIAECESGSPHLYEPSVRARRAYILLARGEEKQALADWELAIAIARRSEIPAEVVSCLAAGAHFYSQLGRPAEAQALADELLGHDAEEVADDGLELAWVAGRIGRGTEFREKVDAARSFGTHWFRRVADLMLAGDLAKAADLARDGGMVSIEAGIRLRAAEELSELGRQDEANEQLEQAMAFYRSVGATRYIREAEALLSTPV